MSDMEELLVEGWRRPEGGQLNRWVTSNSSRPQKHVCVERDVKSLLPASSEELGGGGGTGLVVVGMVVGGWGDVDTLVAILMKRLNGEFATQLTDRGPQKPSSSRTVFR